MEHFSRKNLLLSLPVFAVEAATLLNLIFYYLYHELTAAAVLLAISYSTLLIATAVLIAQNLSGPVRALLGLGGALLFLVQAASNVSEAYLRGRERLPAAELGVLWGMSAQEWLVRSSFI